MAGLHSPGDFGPLAEAAVVESDKIRKAIRCVLSCWHVLMVVVKVTVVV